MRAMVPVSVRAQDEHGALGNRVAAMMAPLPVWCEDPVERLHLITASMGDLKSSGQAVGAQILSQMTDFAPPTIAAQAARLTPRQRFFNLVVTNVPGPQIALYMLGREMEAIFPMVPLAQRQALCVGIMSYNGQINFGLIGDFDAMADLDGFGLDLEAAIAEISAATPKVKGRKGKAKRKAPRRSRPRRPADPARGPPPPRGEPSAPAAILLRSMQRTDEAAASRGSMKSSCGSAARPGRGGRGSASRRGLPRRWSCPQRMSEREVDRVIRDHRDWIAEKVAWARQEAERTPLLGLDRPGVVWLAGRALSRSSCAAAGVLSPSFAMAGSRRRPGRGAAAAIGRWYRREARRRLSRATAREAEALGVRPARMSIRDPRTRWGSCTAAGAISYSWRLVICPPPVLDYVVVHELCHLRVHDHSKAFWGLLRESAPAGRSRRSGFGPTRCEIGAYAPRPC